MAPGALSVLGRPSAYSAEHLTSTGAPMDLELKLERYILDEQVRRSQASADRWFTALKVATIVLGLVSWTMLVIALR